MTSSIRGPRALRGKEGDEVEKGQTKKKKKKKKEGPRESAIGNGRKPKCGSSSLAGDEASGVGS